MILISKESQPVPWHVESIGELKQKLDIDPVKGLSEDEARERLQDFGKNELEEKKSKSPFRIFIAQFNDFMIWILIAAALISGIILREITDAIVIIVILVINSVLGFVQEYRAEKALQALKELASPTALVLRDGSEKKISSKLLVPGDVIKLASGDLIPADCRIINSTNLQTNEAPMTGESMQVEKSADTLDRVNIPLGDRINMLFSGTTVTKGRCTAVVVETGSRTEIGKIADLVQEEEEQTPLQKELKTVGKRIGIICLSVSAVVFGAGVLKGYLALAQGVSTGTMRDVISTMLLVAVALAVASIPEGLPAIVTISLALGVQKMAKSNAIVRRLSSVETLGGVSVICTDKTGTLTQNKMAVKKLYTGLEENRTYEYACSIKPRDGEKKTEKIPDLAELKQNTGLKILLESAVLCNDAYYLDKDSCEIAGDPTEAALIEMGNAYSLDKDELESTLPRDFEEPFDSVRKMMTTVHKLTDEYLSYQDTTETIKRSQEYSSGNKIPRYIMFSKGAPEVIASKCNLMIKDNSIISLSNKDKSKIT